MSKKGKRRKRNERTNHTTWRGGTRRQSRSSLDVARVFEKEHKNVLQAIENLDCSFDFQGLNFERSTIKVPMPKGGEMAAVKRKS